MIMLAALTAPLTASGASGGARATPVSRSAVEPGSPARRWAKIASRVRLEAGGTVLPLLPAEAGGSFEGSAATSAAVGTLGAAVAGCDFALGVSAAIWWRALISARVSLTPSRFWVP